MEDEGDDSRAPWRKDAAYDEKPPQVDFPNDEVGMSPVLRGGPADLSSQFLVTVLEATQLMHLRSLFVQEGVVTERAIRKLTDDELRGMGVQKFGERKELLEYLKEISGNARIHPT